MFSAVMIKRFTTCFGLLLLTVSVFHCRVACLEATGPDDHCPASENSILYPTCRVIAPNVDDNDNRNDYDYDFEDLTDVTVIREKLDSSGYLKPGSPWGYAIYRTAYGPDTDELWDRTLTLLRQGVVDKLSENAGDLLDRHVLTVMDNQSRFDGASEDEVRDAYFSWVLAELREWQLDSKDDKWDCSSPMPEQYGTRYGFHLLFDASCIGHAHPRPVVKLAVGLWGVVDLTDSCSVDEVDNYYMTNEDLGWMYIDLSWYIESYVEFDSPYKWDAYFVNAHEVWPPIEDI